MCVTPERAFRWTSSFQKLRSGLDFMCRISLSSQTAKEIAVNKWARTVATRSANACTSGARTEMPKPYRQHLRSSSDLETTYEAVRAGFVVLALEKNRRATPFVAQARALKTAAS